MIGLLAILIEDSLKKETFIPLSLFFLPTIFYYLIARETKLNNLRYEIYLIIGILYISICLIEFSEGYSLDKLMSVYWSKGNGDHPMSYVLRLVPIAYKSFRLGLSLVFFRIAYLVFRHHKINVGN